MKYDCASPPKNNITSQILLQLAKIISPTKIYITCQKIHHLTYYMPPKIISPQKSPHLPNITSPPKNYILPKIISASKNYITSQKLYHILKIYHFPKITHLRKITSHVKITSPTKILSLHRKDCLPKITSPHTLHLLNLHHLPNIASSL